MEDEAGSLISSESSDDQPGVEYNLDIPTPDSPVTGAPTVPSLNDGGGQLAALLSRLERLERDNRTQASSSSTSSKKKKLLGQSGTSDATTLLRLAKRDHSQVSNALAKARKPFDKPIAVPFRSSEKDKEVSNQLKNVLYDNMRIIPSLAAIADTLEEICDDIVDQDVIDRLMAIRDTTGAVTALVNLQAQSIRLKLWRTTATAVAPSVKAAETEALITKHWEKDDLQGFIAELMKSETSYSMIESNRIIARALQKPPPPRTPNPTDRTKRGDRTKKEDRTPPKKQDDKAAQSQDGTAADDQ